MEEIPTPEALEKLTLIETLRAKGFEDVEVRELLRIWSIKKEQVAMEVGTREAQFDFEIERAEIYRDAGQREMAYEVLEDARIMAYLEGNTEYVKKIDSLIDSV
ncbi:hypothetical protein BH11PAT3_BH11PAT3_0680 [soil metagenome]